jgi:iron complex transport system ATP-binding protein
MTDNKPALPLRCEALSIGVAECTLVRDLAFTAPAGSITCVLGRNGAGKTLMLHTLAGARAPQSGSIYIGDRELAAWPQRELGRHLGLLAQTDEDPFPATVLDSVLIGRHPHIDFWSWETARDRDIALASLQAVDLVHFGARDLTTLSGGERRRAALATLLTQNPEVMLLDEPINHLDPHHQMDVVQLLRTKAAEGRTIIASMHDPGLAARFANYAVLLFGDGRWHFGPVDEALTEASLSELYRAPLRELIWETGRAFVPE